MKLYSKVEPDTLLHIVWNKGDITNKRNNLVPEKEFIQCSCFTLEHAQTFRPHKHLLQSRHYDNYIPQELWIVISGLVEVTYYDLDDTILKKELLAAGDCSITLRGGHTYTCINSAVVYEIKSGPYLGVENDKEFIDE